MVSLSINIPEHFYSCYIILAFIFSIIPQQIPFYIIHIIFQICTRTIIHLLNVTIHYDSFNTKKYENIYINFICYNLNFMGNSYCVFSRLCNPICSIVFLLVYMSVVAMLMYLITF